jgi:predicted metal-dependent phosphoesterase TrpH
MKADLHIHSSYSNDGEISIPDIIKQCQESGVDIFSITDHNGIRGSREASRLITDGHALNFIPGIEIDCNHRGTDLHLLGYQVGLENGDFDALERSNRKKHMDAVPRMIHNLAQLGIKVGLEELLEKSGGNPPSAELFAELLLQKPDRGDNPKLLPYLPGGERSDMPLINFYLDFFAQGKPAYVKINHMPFTEAVDLVKSNGGFPIVAHPGLNLKGREDMVKELLDLGAAGLEVFNNYHSGRQLNFFAELCRSRSVLMTCGSDFHGKNKPLISIGRYSGPGNHADYLERCLSRILDHNVDY